MTEHNQTPYSLTAVRALALHAQGLGSPLPTPTPNNIYDQIMRLGCIQIDSLQMVQRSQYVALWSRFGQYNPADLDKLAYGTSDSPINDRKLFEYWLHEACYIPLHDFRYALPIMRRFRDDTNRWAEYIINDPNTRQLMPVILEYIKSNGSSRASDFDREIPRRGTWWNWKPSKRVLEYLFYRGDLMIMDRKNFQRVYDLRERILPDWVDTTEPSMEEMYEYYTERAVKALGVCFPLQAANYTKMKRADVRPTLTKLTKDGILVHISAELHDGQQHEMMVHRDNLPLLQQAADGAHVPQRTTFLSPFDSLLWAKDRVMQIWNFFPAIEAYVPEPKRRWGYFCLPILHKDRLVGRFDPKLERATGTLRIKVLHLEPGIAPDEELVKGVAAAFRDFMAFHKATNLIIEKSNPAKPDFGKKVMKAL